ncbi:MAG: hypothetical protein ACE5OY_06285 [Candidatus Bathyarchaeia archaeon]
MYLIDPNVFLELELDQERAHVCGSFLERGQREDLEAVITDFQVDTVGRRHGKLREEAGGS